MCKFVGKELRETRAHLDAARGGIHAILYPEIYEEEVNNEDTCQFKPISSYFLGEI